MIIIIIIILTIIIIIIIHLVSAQKLYIEVEKMSSSSL